MRFSDKPDRLKVPIPEDARAHLSFRQQLVEPLELLHLTMLLNHPMTRSVAKVP